MDPFETRLDSLDLGLFHTIESQTSDLDKKSLLACQQSARNILQGGYVYLEIGSHLGGSIQPYLLDERCRKIYSIDKRPERQPDARGQSFAYPENSAARMLDHLAKVSKEQLSKVECIDSDVSEVETSAINEAPDICFIDGEHTDEAAWRDFNFCLGVAKKDCVILFHDSAIVYNALHRVVELLNERSLSFRAYNLPEMIFVVEIGDIEPNRSVHIRKLLLDNHLGYLYSLRFNDHFRRTANSWSVRFLLRLAGWFRLKG